MPNLRPVPPRSWSYPIARFDSAVLLPHVPTPSSFGLASVVSEPTSSAHASPAALVCDSPEVLPCDAATKSRGDTHTRAFLHRPQRSAHRGFVRRDSLVAFFGSTNSTG